MTIPPRKPRKDGGSDIQTTCANCGVELVADQRHAGKKATCPECGSSLTIPDRPERLERPVREEPPSRRRPPPSLPPAPRALPSDRYRLRDEPAPAESRPAADKLGAAATKVAQTILGGDIDANHRVRAKLVGWLRRAAIVVIAFAIIKVFEASFASVLIRTPPTLHNAVAWLTGDLKAIPGCLRLLTVPRPVELGLLTSPERFVLGMAMIVFATGLLVRAKLLDAIYVTTARWGERTVAGLGMHFMALLVQAGILAWAASSTKSPNASDGFTCGLLALLLLVSAAWMLTLHLVAATELPELKCWMVIDFVFGCAIFLVVLWPGLTQLWTRAGATAVLFLADSIVSLHVGATFVFARRNRRWWWHKPLSIVASVLIILLTALLLACVR